MRRAHLIFPIAALLFAAPARAQAPPAGASQGDTVAAVAAANAGARLSEHPASLVFVNRHVAVFRADVLGRPPADRAAGAVQFLHRLVDESPNGRVTTERVGDSVLVGIDNRPVFGILPLDADTLAGETVEQTAAAVAARLQTAFDEAVELRNPARLLQSGLVALAATLLYVAAVWLLRRAYRASAARLGLRAERQLERLPGGEIIMHGSHAPVLVRRASGVVTVLLLILLTDLWLTFVLRRFPYTRPWGDSMRSVVLSNLLSIGRHVVEALPGLVTVLVVVVATRFLVRLTARLFEAVEKGQLSTPGLYPETAPSTRRIVTALLWLFALVVSYGYLPGSDSDAFKGVSVFVGLMVSLGSTGIMNQIMSGLTLTYSRALRLGDFVKIGDVEGTVAHLGTLATKIRTPRHEEITIPNAVVVSSATTNYSRHARDGVFVPTSLTIGYDTPWRQVQALLLLAAGRTPGLLSAPKPVVRQTALQDSYVHYTLLVCLEQPQLRVPVLDALHANIQDAFNEYGVQIMSPNYEADPSAPKVVRKDDWFAAPAGHPTAAEPAGNGRLGG